MGTLQGGGTLRVMLRYCPQPNTAPAAPDASTLQSAASSTATAEDGYDGADGGQDDKVCALPEVAAFENIKLLTLAELLAK